MRTEPLRAIRSGTTYIVAHGAHPQPVPHATAPLAQFVGGCHWKIRNVETLATLLQSLGYIELPQEAPNEYSRFWKPCHGSIIIKANGWASARGGGMVDLAEIKKAGL